MQIDDCREVMVILFVLFGLNFCLDLSPNRQPTLKSSDSRRHCQEMTGNVNKPIDTLERKIRHRLCLLTACVCVCDRLRVCVCAASDGLQRGLPHGSGPAAPRQHQLGPLAAGSWDGSGLRDQQGRPGHLPASVSARKRTHTHTCAPKGQRFSTGTDGVSENTFPTELTFIPHKKKN